MTENTPFLLVVSRTCAYGLGDIGALFRRVCDGVLTPALTPSSLCSRLI